MNGCEIRLVEEKDIEILFEHLKEFLRLETRLLMVPILLM